MEVDLREEVDPQEAVAGAADAVVALPEAVLDPAASAAAAAVAADLAVCSGPPILAVSTR
jgi:hypothetical protein